MLIFGWVILLMAEILHQLMLVVFPIIYRVSAPSQVVSRISSINSILCSSSCFFLEPGGGAWMSQSRWKLGKG